MFWRSRLGRVTHASQNFAITSLNSNGEFTTSTRRDSDGKPQQAAKMQDKECNQPSPPQQQPPGPPPPPPPPLPGTGQESWEGTGSIVDTLFKNAINTAYKTAAERGEIRASAIRRIARNKQRKQQSQRPATAPKHEQAVAPPTARTLVRRSRKRSNGASQECEAYVPGNEAATLARDARRRSLAQSLSAVANESIPSSSSAKRTGSIKLEEGPADDRLAGRPRTREELISSLRTSRPAKRAAPPSTLSTPQKRRAAPTAPADAATTSIHVNGTRARLLGGDALAAMRHMIKLPAWERNPPQPRAGASRVRGTAE